MRSLTVLHLAPHPDDEAIGAPATLLALRAAGHRIVNVACTLGRPEQAERRAAEVRRACELAGFELEVLDPPLAASAGDDHAAARARLAGWLAGRIGELHADLVVSSSPHDAHHAHEVVGRAARDGIERSGRPVRWWLWGLWADLPLPTLVTTFGEERMDEALTVLAAHAGELERNDYPALVRGRATADRVLGPERAFGLGSEGLDVPYAELLTELSRPQDDGRWLAHEPRVLDAGEPLEGPVGAIDLTWWLDEPSFRERLGRG